MVSPGKIRAHSRGRRLMRPMVKPNCRRRRLPRFLVFRGTESAQSRAYQPNGGLNSQKQSSHPYSFGWLFFWPAARHCKRYHLTAFRCILQDFLFSLFRGRTKITVSWRQNSHADSVWPSTTSPRRCLPTASRSSVSAWKRFAAATT